MSDFQNISHDDERLSEPDVVTPAAAEPARVLKQAAAKRGKTGRRRGSLASTIVAFAVLFGGLGIIAYPTFSDWWNSYHQTRAIATYVSAVEDTNPEVIAAMMADARAYNDKLAQTGNRFNMTDAERTEYQSLLNLMGNGVMGYIQISSINVDYPIYHGMDESVLQVAIGHLEGTSLPIGGDTTHSVVSGHRGLPSARLFTDLDKLVAGDTFTITVLDQTITYQVDQIRIVLPTDLSDLGIQKGKDYCTLVTCTPYGINTHRLLVRGHRIENLINDLITPEAVQVPRYVAIPAVGIPMLFIFLVGMLIYYRTRYPLVSKEQVVDTIREAINEADDFDHVGKER